jgi:hypothetical protein
VVEGAAISLLRCHCCGGGGGRVGCCRVCGDGGGG